MDQFLGAGLEDSGVLLGCLQSLRPRNIGEAARLDAFEAYSQEYCRCYWLLLQRSAHVVIGDERSDAFHFQDMVFHGTILSPLLLRPERGEPVGRSANQSKAKPRMLGVSKGITMRK